MKNRRFGDVLLVMRDRVWLRLKVEKEIIRVLRHYFKHGLAEKSENLKET